jgi:hypothetical protein
VRELEAKQEKLTQNIVYLSATQKPEIQDPDIKEKIQSGIEKMTLQIQALDDEIEKMKKQVE